MAKEKKYRSSEWYNSKTHRRDTFVHRGWMRNQGYPSHLFDGRPVIGICNGFQVLVKMGLLPGDEDISLEQTASLTLNDSGHYEDRWVTLEFDNNSHCIWTKGLKRMRVPVRHGEGKFVTKDKTLSAQFEHTIGVTSEGFEIFTKSKKNYDQPPYNL